MQDGKTRFQLQCRLKQICCRLINQINIFPGDAFYNGRRDLRNRAASAGVNSSPPSAAYMFQWNGSALVQVMACRLVGTKPLPEPALTYCQLDHEEQTLKFEWEYITVHSWKCISNCRLRNVGLLSRGRWVDKIPLLSPLVDGESLAGEYVSNRTIAKLISGLALEPHIRECHSYECIRTDIYIYTL